MLYIVDFDETITAYDTIHLLAEAVNKPEEWSVISDKYWQEYLAWREALPHSTTLTSYLPLLGGSRYLEEASIKRIEKSQYFSGLSEGALDNIVQLITLRAGFVEFINALVPDLRVSKTIFHVLSVNWSARVIEQTLLHHTDLTADLLCVHANDFDFDTSTNTTNGRILARNASSLLMNSTDKVREFRRIVQTDAVSSPLNVVYIGDSPTDFGCLQISPISILMRSNQKYYDILSRFEDVQLVDISEFPVQKAVPGKKIIYTCSDWCAIQKAFLA
ncbi:CTO1 family protein C17G9.12c [Schizosaccharomyces pombe]